MNLDAGLSVERRRGEVIRCLFVVRLLVTVGRHDSREGDGGRIITNQEPRQLTSKTFKAIQGRGESSELCCRAKSTGVRNKRSGDLRAVCSGLGISSSLPIRIVNHHYQFHPESHSARYS